MNDKLHYYSSDNLARRMVNVYLALISILLSYILHLITSSYHIQIPWWFDAPAVFGFYGLIYWLFDKILWKNKLIRFIFNLKTPNWNGVYTGTLKGSFDNFSEDKSFELTLIQNWSTICISSRSSISKSHSRTATFAIADRKTPSLVFEYFNNPFVDAPEDKHSHRGMAILHFEGSKLIGEYFTGRGRNTFGSYELEKVK